MPTQFWFHIIQTLHIDCLHIVDEHIVLLTDLINFCSNLNQILLMSSGWINGLHLLLYEVWVNFF